MIPPIVYLHLLQLHLLLAGHLRITATGHNSQVVLIKQSEGSGVWIPATGSDISVMPVNSFYGLSPQAQHLAFTPGQPGHCVCGGMYHPAQTLAAAGVHPLLQQSQAMAGAVEGPAGPYQQPQRAQMNWANNY